MEMPSQYAVMGDPIQHSMSPNIYAFFAKQFNLPPGYDRIRVSAGQLSESVTTFRAQGGMGLNITAPLKAEAYAICEPEKRARVAQAANTLYWDGSNVLCGANTDGIGLSKDVLVNLNWPLAGSNILICGAGGAAAGIIEPLLSEKPAEIVIANREVKRATELIERFDNAILKVCSYDDLNAHFDIIFNATSASLSDNTLPLNPKCFEDALCYDLNYALGLTPFCELARQHQAKSIVDGLGMLIEQAAYSFEIWHGIMPDTRGLQSILRNLKS